ncbi:MAG: hypothetical protein ACRYFU_14695 [Janthinobacterium lividum]
MPLHILDPIEAGHGMPPEAEAPHQAEILRQLESIANSSLFSKSKRYPTFLRYIVEHTLAGRTDLLKERTLGIEVFHRQSDYDTNADPVVRITAGEIRKRLAQYYQIPGHEYELRVDLPIGSYTPLFSRPSHDFVAAVPVPAVVPAVRVESEIDGSLSEPAAVSELPALEQEGKLAETPAGAEEGRASGPSQRFWMALTGLLIAFGMMMAALAAAPVWDRWHKGGLAYFWNSVLHAEGPALIVIGVHSFGANGKDISPATYAATGQDHSMLSSMTSADMIPLSDVVSYGHITDLLTEYPHAYKTQSAAETTFGQLQPGPVILIGGLDNFWTLRLTSTLRFRFVAPSCLPGQPCSDGAIEDTQHAGTSWHFDTAQSARSNSRDYAIVANFFDPQIEQRVVIAAGIGKSGTAAAANFLTTNRSLQVWAGQAHVPRGTNIELVLSTEIVEGQQGPPHVVAWTSW